MNLVSRWHCGVTVNTGIRLHPRRRNTMMIKDSLEQDFIEKNTLVFKMDRGTAGCKQRRYEDFLNVMKSMRIKSGRKKGSMLSVMNMMVIVGRTKDLMLGALGNTMGEVGGISC